MTIIKVKQRPIKLPNAQKRELRTQFGALCYRIQQDKVQVLLITSRGRKRWIVPKGWPMDEITPAKAASQEAFEEAGVDGKITGNCIGIYSYNKSVENEEPLSCMIALFPLKVKRLHAIYPEYKQRKRGWFSLKKAAAMVEEPELSQIIKNFDPRQNSNRT